MDFGGSQKLGAVNRSLLLVVPLSALLLAFIGWNVCHYRLDQEHRTDVLSEERASKATVALAKEESDRANLKKRSRDAESNARIQQLYEEINNLTRVGEGVLLPKNAQSVPGTMGGQDKTAVVP
jgi:hypothetical protein